MGWAWSWEKFSLVVALVHFDGSARPRRGHSTQRFELILILEHFERTAVAK